MSKSLSLLTLLSLVCFFTLPAYAADLNELTSISPTPATAATPRATESPKTEATASSTALTREAQEKQTRLTALKTQGDTLIAERLKSLSELNASLSAAKTSTSSEGIAALTSISSATQGLTALKLQIDAVTDPSQIDTVLKPLVKGIFSNYRIYELEIPRDHGLAHLALLDQLSGNYAVVQQNMSKDLAYAEGQPTIDSTLLKADNAKFAADVAKQNTDLTATQNLLISLAPQSYPGDKNSLAQTKTNLTTLHADAEAIHADYAKFVKDFKAEFDLK